MPLFGYVPRAHTRGGCNVCGKPQQVCFYLHKKNVASTFLACEKCDGMELWPKIKKKSSSSPKKNT